MNKKTIKITESQLRNTIKRVLKEYEEDEADFYDKEEFMHASITRFIREANPKEFINALTGYAKKEPVVYNMYQNFVKMYKQYGYEAALEDFISKYSEDGAFYLLARQLGY